MRPAKLSTNLFSELPPVLAHFLENNRSGAIETDAKRGRLSLLKRSGTFQDMESQAVERRQHLELLGLQRARSMYYRIGFEQGRRDGARYFKKYEGNARLALQAGEVFGQLQGRYVGECREFEYDAEDRTLLREVVYSSSTEAAVHRMASGGHNVCACWNASGYMSGYISEILGRRVITLETECICKGDPACRFVSKLDAQWDSEADWARNALRTRSLTAELNELKEELAATKRAARQMQGSLSGLSKRTGSELMLETLIADSEAMLPVIKRIRQLTSSPAPVLFLGEEGSGKETFARAIHMSGPRKDKPFVIVNTKGTPKEQLAQELFGAAAGVIPGSASDYSGALVAADGGTVYVDEITNLPHEVQEQLLSSMKDGRIRPIGAETSKPLNARIVLGTQFETDDVEYRRNVCEELNFALSAGSVEIPPLRDRGSDVLRLAESVLDEFAAKYDKAGLEMNGDVKKLLTDCTWPGNIRQLRNVVEHAVIMCQDEEIGLGDLPEDIVAAKWTQGHRELTPEVVEAALRKTNGNRTHAAELLGVGRTTLWRAIKRLDVA